MSKLELNQIYLELELQIKRLDQSNLHVHKDIMREDAQDVISMLRNEIDSWISRLNERTISCNDIENLLVSQKNNIKLERLKSKNVDENELETFRNDILRLIARAIMNTYLESLFRNQNRQLHEDDNLFEA